MVRVDPLSLGERAKLQSVGATLQIEKMVYGGEGLAREEGKVILLPFVIPGEHVEAANLEYSRGITRGRPERVVEPSPQRVAAECPYFGRCGGCQYQHGAYGAQLEWKQAILLETLARVGRVAAPENVSVISAEPWGYRNRVQLHFAEGRLGYLRSHSRELCDIDHCPIASPKLNSVIAALSGMMRDRKWPGFLDSLEVFTNETDVQLNVLRSSRPLAKWFFEWCGEGISGFVPGPLDYAVGVDRYRVSGQSFFQVNRFLLERLIDAALRDAAGEQALDLYAGVGLFSLPLARRFERVIAVEAGAGASRDLGYNTTRAGARVEVHAADAEEFLAGFDARLDFLLADPPRAGLGKRVVRRIAELQPYRLVLVSCDPATLARDLADLQASGYGIEELTLVDLFPQTYHLETVVRLRRGGA